MLSEVPPRSPPAAAAVGALLRRHPGSIGANAAVDAAMKKMRRSTVERFTQVDDDQGTAFANRAMLLTASEKPLFGRPSAVPGGRLAVGGFAWPAASKGISNRRIRGSDAQSGTRAERIRDGRN